MSIVAFSQTDTRYKDSLTILFPPRHYTNHFININQPVAAMLPISLRNVTVNKSSVVFTNRYAGTITWHQREAVWKDILGFAGQTALFYYEDTHLLTHYYPR